MPGAGKDAANAGVIKSSWLRRFMGDVYAPTLVNWVVKAVVICLYLTYVGVSIYGATQLTEGEPLQVCDSMCGMLRGGIWV
jgi:Patched family